MKRKFKIQLPVILMLGIFIFAASQFKTDSGDDSFKYIGVDKCAGTCHKGESKGNQLEIWKDSKHAQAFKTLQTPFADSIANAKGHSTPAAETPECVVCHVLGREIMPEAMDVTFDKTEGVQCESCHGPGSEYKKLSIMKDKQKSIDAGLIVHSDGEAFCTNCHNSNSPTMKEFNYAEMWDQIKHPKPAGEE